MSDVVLIPIKSCGECPYRGTLGEECTFPEPLNRFKITNVWVVHELCPFRASNARLNESPENNAI